MKVIIAMGRKHDSDDGNDITKEKEAPRVLQGWRLDPKESFTDWTIQVTRISDRDESDKGGVDNHCYCPAETYHVHKYFLGAGPRRASYFNGVFHATELEEYKSGITHLELEESAAASFPAFLDYIYSANDVDVTSESAIALRHLSEYFRVPTLYQSVSDFLQKDLSESNVHIYCREALLYHDSEIVEACMKMVARARYQLLAEPSIEKSEASPAQLTMEMLSTEQQNQVLKYALQESEEESKRLKSNTTALLLGQNLLTAKFPNPFLWNSKS